MISISHRIATKSPGGDKWSLRENPVPNLQVKSLKRLDYAQIAVSC
jgi:hypothetical protein